ncbi:MAG TPA: hypothetical protein VK399_05630 [Longimicrobiaceae bacterium]|nr:hypothetical protein [Longimicrobiaceae bacterium]
MIAYPEARDLVAPLYRALERVADRVMIVGALRRREDVTGPIDILVRPSESPGDLFGGSQADYDSVRAAVRGWGDVTRETPSVLEAVARGTSNLRAAILIVGPDTTWGWIVLRHTGPLPFARYVQRSLEGQGIQVSSDGMRLLTSSSAVVEAVDEATVFALAATAVVPPEDRAAVEVAYDDMPAPRSTSRAASHLRHRGEHQGRGMTIERDDDP